LDAIYESARRTTHWDGQEEDEEEELLEALHGGVSARGSVSAGRRREQSGLDQSAEAGRVLYLPSVFSRRERMSRWICNGRDEDKEGNYNHNSLDPGGDE
jgi:hypothetical protein